MSEINYSLDRLIEEQNERGAILNVIKQLKKEFSIANLRILELGSGSGANLAILLPENKVLGVEGLPDAAKHAQDMGIETIVADLENSLPLENSEFDWVFCLDVLEHLAWPDRTLCEAHRLLKPGGKLLVNVPNHFTLTGRVRMLQGHGIHWNRYFPASHDWNNPHIRFFTQKSITQLLKVSGFEIVRDLSPQAPAVPMSHQLRQLGLSRLVNALAKFNPSLFCGGFFLLAERI